MPAHNVIGEINKANAVGDTKVADFGDQGIATDLIAESTSGSGVTIDSVVLKDGGVTLSGETVRTGGDKTPAIVIADADYTVLAANSGKIHHIANVSADRTFTLPAAAAGLYYEFWSTMVAADGHDWIFDAGADANFFLGGLVWIDSDAADSITSAGDGDSNSILQINVPSTGTQIHMYCDGTNWFLNGQVFSTTAPAFSDQS